MLGTVLDDYSIRVTDVFAMPQSGTGVSVEAVDPVYQTKFLDMMKSASPRRGAAGGLGADGLCARRRPSKTRPHDGQ